MKEFKDLRFKPHTFSGICAKMMFSNGYGISVVANSFSYGGSEGLYECAVIDENGEIRYDTPVTSDVIGWCSEDDVSRIMRQIQRLKKRESQQD